MQSPTTPNKAAGAGDSHSPATQSQITFQTMEGTVVKVSRQAIEQSDVQVLKDMLAGKYANKTTSEGHLVFTATPDQDLALIVRYLESDFRFDDLSDTQLKLAERVGKHFASKSMAQRANTERARRAAIPFFETQFADAIAEGLSYHAKTLAKNIERSITTFRKEFPDRTQFEATMQMAGPIVRESELYTIFSPLDETWKAPVDWCFTHHDAQDKLSRDRVRYQLTSLDLVEFADILTLYERLERKLVEAGCRNVELAMAGKKATKSADWAEFTALMVKQHQLKFVFPAK